MMKKLKLMALLSLALCVSQLCAQTPEQIERLKTFAKLSGYVRYFHPSNESHLLNWNNFNIYACNKILACNSQQEFEGLLNEWMSLIAPSMKIVKKGSAYTFDQAALRPASGKYRWVNWSHSGLSSDMNVNFNVYNSHRLNARDPLEDNSYYNYPLTISSKAFISDFKGKTLRVEARVRMKQSKAGSACLWMSMFDKSSHNVLYRNSSDNPARSDKWYNYTVMAQVPDEADYVTFGLLVDAGTAYMDDVKLSYLDGEVWKPISVYNADFEVGKINVKNFNDWYFKTAKGQKISIENDKAGNHFLCANYESNLYRIKKESDMHNPVSNGAVINKSIGSGLEIYMPVSLAFQKGKTYPASDELKIQALYFDNLGYVSGLPLYLGNIITTWNIMQHFYPYFDVVKCDWNGALEKSLKACFSAKSELEFKSVLDKLVAHLKDGHASVSTPAYNYDTYYKPGIDWAYIEGKLYITKVCQSWLKVKPGQEVKSINGRSVVDFMDSFRSVVSAPTEGWFKHRFTQFSLSGLKDTKIELGLEDTTIVLFRNQQLYKTDDVECSCQPEIKQIKFKWLDSGILYLNLTKMEDEDLKKVMPDILKAKGLVCDMRGYPSVGVDFIMQLMNQKESDYWMFVPKVHFPDYEQVDYSKLGWNLRPMQPHISAKVVFITGPGAVSYGESFMGYIQGLKLATTVGTPTAGTNGNVNMCILPGGFRVVFTGMRVLKHDGSTLHTIGFEPDYPVDMSLDDLINNKDPQLVKALELVK